MMYLFAMMAAIGVPALLFGSFLERFILRERPVNWLHDVIDITLFGGGFLAMVGVAGLIAGGLLIFLDLVL